MIPSSGESRQITHHYTSIPGTFRGRVKTRVTCISGHGLSNRTTCTTVANGGMIAALTIHHGHKIFTSPILTNLPVLIKKVTEAA